MALRPAILQRYVATLDITRLVQSQFERSQKIRGIIWCRAIDVADARELLRPRGAGRRPRERRCKDHGPAKVTTVHPYSVQTAENGTLLAASSVTPDEWRSLGARPYLLAVEPANGVTKVTRYRRRGKVTVNSLKAPTSLSTVIVPPCCCVTMS
jgi:hypothetical protein